MTLILAHGACGADWYVGDRSKQLKRDKREYVGDESETIMIKHISLENFKCFGERVDIPLAPITLIFGENSAGKSSILQFLTILKQTLAFAPTTNPFMTRGERAIVDAGGFRDILHDRNDAKTLGFGVSFAISRDNIPPWETEEMADERFAPTPVGLSVDPVNRGCRISRLSRPGLTVVDCSIPRPWYMAPCDRLLNDGRVVVRVSNPRQDEVIKFARANRELLLKGFDKHLQLMALRKHDPTAKQFWSVRMPEIERTFSAPPPSDLPLSSVFGLEVRPLPVHVDANHVFGDFAIHESHAPFLMPFATDASVNALRDPTVASELERLRADNDELISFLKSDFSPADFVDRADLVDRVGYAMLNHFVFRGVVVRDWSPLESWLRLGAMNVTLCPWQSVVPFPDKWGAWWCLAPGWQIAFGDVARLKDRESGRSFLSQFYSFGEPSHAFTKEYRKDFNVITDGGSRFGYDFELTEGGSGWFHSVWAGEMVGDFIGTALNAPRLLAPKGALQSGDSPARQKTARESEPPRESQRIVFMTHDDALDEREAKAPDPRVAELVAMRAIGPLRLLGKRLHFSAGATPTEAGHDGVNVHEMLSLDAALRDEVNLWMGKLGVDYEIEIRRLDDQVEGLSLMLLRDRRRENAKPVTLADVGTGVSQVLPIVVESLASENTAILIEQPELHIHPRLQAELGSLFAESVSKRNNQIIAETHSEHLILRIQKLIRTKKLKPEDVSVLYVSRCHDGSNVKRLRIDDDGEFLDLWPDGFFPERMKEVLG